MKPLLLLLLLTATIPVRADELCVRHIVVPGYPRLARMANLQGTVKVEIDIAKDGRVLSARGKGAHELLIRAAEENVRHWDFETCSTEHRAFSKQTISYVYKLSGERQYYDSMPLVVLDLPFHIEITAHPPEPQPERPR